MLSTLVLCLALSQAAGDAPAAPEAPKASDAATAARPSTRKPKAPASDRWTLEYEAGPLRKFVDPDSGTAYWYTTYTVFNRGEADRVVAPRWELVDEHGRICPEGKGVPSDVRRRIQRLLNDPLLEDGGCIIGPVGRGPENARAGFVVFPVSDDVRRFTIFVSGLSSERGEIKEVKSGGSAPTRKTLRMDYQIPGDPSLLHGPVPMAEAPLGDSNPSWIFR